MAASLRPSQGLSWKTELLVDHRPNRTDCSILRDNIQVTASDGAEAIRCISDVIFRYKGQPDSVDTVITITAGPEASLRVLSPSTTIISLGTEGTDTMFAARAMASDQPIRRSLSATTGLCQAGSQICPNLRGVFSCVDVKNGIFRECFLQSECRGLLLG